MDPGTGLPGKSTLFGDEDNIPRAITSKHMSNKQEGRPFSYRKELSPEPLTVSDVLVGVSLLLGDTMTTATLREDNI